MTAPSKHLHFLTASSSQPLDSWPNSIELFGNFSWTAHKHPSSSKVSAEVCFRTVFLWAAVSFQTARVREHFLLRYGHFPAFLQAPCCLPSRLWAPTHMACPIHHIEKIINLIKKIKILADCYYFRQFLARAGPVSIWNKGCS